MPWIVIVPMKNYEISYVEIFVMCSMIDLEAKRFCLVFPEGKGLIGGWATLAKKLRSLRVVTPIEFKDAYTLVKGR